MTAHGYIPTIVYQFKFWITINQQNRTYITGGKAKQY